MEESGEGPRGRAEQMRQVLRKYLGATFADMCARTLTRANTFALDAGQKARFKWLNWGPRGAMPTYLGYYPDSVRGNPRLRAVYHQWIRGNELNNNGDASRFLGLWLNLQRLTREEIEGDFAELGVWKGNSAAVLAEFAELSGKRLFLLDTFSGFDERDMVGVDQIKEKLFTDTSLQYAQETVQHAGCTTYIQGFFPESVTEELAAARFALAHIDCDLYEPMKAALEFFYPRLSRGGMLLMHDYESGSWSGATRAIDDFCAATGEFVSLWPDKSGTAIIRKSAR